MFVDGVSDGFFSLPFNGGEIILGFNTSMFVDERHKIFVTIDWKGERKGGVFIDWWFPEMVRL